MVKAKKTGRAVKGAPSKTKPGKKDYTTKKKLIRVVKGHRVAGRKGYDTGKGMVRVEDHHRVAGRKAYHAGEGMVRVEGGHRLPGHHAFDTHLGSVVYHEGGHDLEGLFHPYQLRHLIIEMEDTKKHAKKPAKKHAKKSPKKPSFGLKRKGNPRYKPVIRKGRKVYVLRKNN